MNVTEQTVIVTITLWAVPLPEWKREEEGVVDTHKVVPYLGDATPWQEEALPISTHTVQLAQDDVTDLHQRTVDKLVGLKQEALDKAMQEARKYDDRLQELLAITAQ